MASLTLSDDVLNTIQCSLDKKSSKKHVSKDPVLLLTCGHVACRACVLKNKGTTFQCQYSDCNKEQMFSDDSSLISVKPAELLIKSNLKELYSMISDEMKYEVFDEEKIEENIEQTFEWMNEQMSLRIESLKSQLDNYEETFQKKMREMKANLKESIPRKEIKEKKERFDEIQNESERSKEGFFECQDSLMYIQDKIEEFSNIHSTVFFDANETELDESIVGKLGSLLTDRPSLKMRLKQNKTDAVTTLIDAVYKLCVLPNSTLCVSFSKSNKLGLYSKDFKLIKLVDQIGSFKLNNPRGVAADIVDKVLVCDSYNSRLILTNLDFAISRAVGKLGSGPYEFNAPYDACFSDRHIYICDCQNFRIQIFTDELIFSQVYHVGYCPFQIRIINDTVCVRGFDDRIYFYNKDDFKEKDKNQDEKKGIISTMSNRFIQLDFKLEEINFYSSDGKFESSSKANYGNYKNCDMCVFNDSLLITGNANGLLII